MFESKTASREHATASYDEVPSAVKVASVPNCMRSHLHLHGIFRSERHVRLLASFMRLHLPTARIESLEYETNLHHRTSPDLLLCLAKHLLEKHSCLLAAVLPERGGAAGRSMDTVASSTACNRGLVMIADCVCEILAGVVGTLRKSVA